MQPVGSKTYIAECAVGRGLFAAEAIPAGAPILTLCGPELTLREVRDKGAAAANALQIGIDRYIDLEEPGRLLNHSCRPNAGIFGDTQVVALQAISADEEIRFDYSTTVSDGWTMACRCDVPECRGLVVAFQLLPAKLRQQYAILGCVQRFIREEVEC